MDKVHNVTRRAAMLGAAISTAALVIPVASVAMEQSEADTPVNIEQLAESFRDAAMKLDPRINDCWIGYDEIARGPRDMRVMSIYFGRKDTPFLQPAPPRQPTITSLFEQWRTERVDPNGETEAQREARFARYHQLQQKITGMRPRSVREAAMQLVVETDDGDTDFRQEFYARLRLVAFGDV